MDENVRSLLTRGREHYRANEYDQAERLLAELARERHPFADVYSMLGVILHQRGKLEESEAMFEEALRINPKYTEAALHLAVTYNDQGKYEEAREVYDRVLSGREQGPPPADRLFKGKIANMHADVGHAYHEAGLYPQAAEEYRKALSLCPGFMDIRARLAMTLRAAGDLKSAIHELEAIKAENPQYLSVRLHLGLAYFEARRTQDAEKEWRDVLTMEPANKFARLYLGMLPGQRGRS